MNKIKNGGTRHNLEMALLRIENKRPRIVNKNRKLSILAVAEEANISSASIHNNYPEIAERIRMQINKEGRMRRSSKRQEFKILTEKNKALRVKILELTMQLRDIASENAKILTENQRLNEIVNEKTI